MCGQNVGTKAEIGEAQKKISNKVKKDGKVDVVSFDKKKGKRYYHNKKKSYYLEKDEGISFSGSPSQNIENNNIKSGDKGSVWKVMDEHASPKRKGTVDQTGRILGK